jgi:hypothetical protein
MWLGRTTAKWRRSSVAISVMPRRSAAAITATATQVASGTVAGQPWTLWSKKSEKGSAALEDAGLLLDGKAYGICPGFPNPAELEIVNPSAGSNGIVFGVSGYNGPATVKVSVGTLNTFSAGKLLLSQRGQPADGTTFFIGELPASACSYQSLELDVKAGRSSPSTTSALGPARQAGSSRSPTAWALGPAPSGSSG